tara:strand:+ start:224 stop:397 length:174 start_codon:yes stop_codon:yes gene_type:complete
MEKELIDKLFGPPINQVLVSQSNLNLTTVLLVVGVLTVVYLICQKKNNDDLIKNNKH